MVGSQPGQTHGPRTVLILSACHLLSAMVHCAEKETTCQVMEGASGAGGQVAGWGGQHLPWDLDGKGQQAETSGENMVPSTLSPRLPPTAPAALPGPRRLPGPCPPRSPASSYCRHGGEMKQSKTNHPEASLGGGVVRVIGVASSVPST